LVAVIVFENKAKKAVQYIGSFEERWRQAARKRGVDTVVCGHIHRAEMRDINGILYCNDGDWVESCSSLVEDMNGHLRLIDWPKLRGKRRPCRLHCPWVRQHERRGR
jgi:UDP-2,3-diacylglucosamine pyrophosphatase LpxH